MSRLNSFLDNSIILPFPGFRQTFNWNCGTTSLNMILAFYGHDVNEDELIKISGANKKEGTPIEGLKIASKKYGLRFKEDFTMSTKDLRDNIDNGFPSLIMIQAWSLLDNPDWDNEWGQGHYVVCFPPKTKILTENGYKSIEDITIGELVLTHNGRFKPVSNVFEREYNGDLINIKSIGMVNSLSMTPEHPVMSKKYKSKITQMIKQTNFLSNTDFKPAKDLELGDIIFSKPFPYEIDFDHINEKKSFLLGCYLGDGCLMRNVNKKMIENRYFKGLRFIIGTKEHHLINKISLYMKSEFNLDTHYYYPKNNNCVHLKFYSVNVANYFKTLCGEPNNKIIHTDIYSLPNNILFNFVDGWYQTDGCNIKTKNLNNMYYRMDTSYENLAYGLKIILEKLNIPFSISIRKEKKDMLIVNNKYDSKKSYGFSLHDIGSNKTQMRFYKNTKLSRLQKIETIKSYSGKVYNLEVTDDNTYIAEGVIVHNCIGYTKDKFIFADPMSIKRVYVTESGLNSRWHGHDDNGKKIGKWGLTFLNKSKYMVNDIEEMG